MHKISVKDIWNAIYGKKEEAYDYAGRLMKKSACGNPNSRYEPTIDHIYPLSRGGRDTRGNIVLCHWETNAEKADAFPHWKANGKRFHAVRDPKQSCGYYIVEEKEEKGKGILCLLAIRD